MRNPGKLVKWKNRESGEWEYGIAYDRDQHESFSKHNKLFVRVTTGVNVFDEKKDSKGKSLIALLNTIEVTFYGFID